MSGRFVRASKFRHVFGRPSKKDQCYDNIRISKNAWDSNIVKVNSQYLSVNWDASGGGAFAVIPLLERGRLPEAIPLFRGHTAVVLDTDWHPFNDQIVCSGSDDGKVFVWKVPEGFTLYTDAEEPEDIGPVAKLTGHSRKVGHVLFNPSADNILASASGDFTVKIWDIEAGSPRLTLKHSDVVQSLSWSANGALMATTSRDKKFRIWDVRQEQPAHIGPGHSGAKNSRSVWMGEFDRIATTGFSRSSERQLGLWDIRSAQEPIGGFEMLDSISGVCMPFWDQASKMLYLAGKGDGNIRYFEYANDKFEYLSEYKSADPQRGVAFLPKKTVNMHENEVMRGFKTVNDSYIEPISFIVPRRAEVFQGDIYPPVAGSSPGVNAAEWMNGKDALPPKIDLESVYEGREPVEVPSDYKAPAPLTPMPQSEPKQAEVAKEPPSAKASVPPTPATARGPPPSMKEQSASVATMVSKFADKEGAEAEEEDDDGDSSSFEEVSKPAARSAQRPAQAPVGPMEKVQEPQQASAATVSSSVKQEEHTKSIEEHAKGPSGSQDASLASRASQDLRRLQEEVSQNNELIRKMSEAMSQQNELIAKLAAKVENLQQGGN